MANLDGRRLGLGAMLGDHVATWSVRSGRERRSDMRRSAAWYFGLPVIPAAVFFVVHVKLQGLGRILSGVTVFTALLFGLLVLMFNTGLALRKESATIKNAHGLRELISDLRANATWAILTGFLLAGVLIVAAATTPAGEGTSWGFTPPVVWLFVHLGLTLLAILRRFRTAFNYLTR